MFITLVVQQGEANPHRQITLNRTIVITDGHIMRRDGLENIMTPRKSEGVKDAGNQRQKMSGKS